MMIDGELFVPNETFEGTIQEITDKLNAHLEQLPFGYESPLFKYRYFGYNGEIEYYLSYLRPETPIERKRRITSEAKKAEAKVKADERKKEKAKDELEKELELYAKLKEKYGP